MKAAFRAFVQVVGERWRSWWHHTAQRQGLLTDPAHLEQMEGDADEREQVMQELNARLSLWTRGKSDDRSGHH